MAIFYTDSGSFNNLEVTGSTILSGSLIVSGATNFGPSGLTGSLFGTASNATSASYALTASYAANGGGSSTPAFPFSGSAVITGSLLVSGSGLQVSGNLSANNTSSLTFLQVSTTDGGLLRGTIELGDSSAFIKRGGGASLSSLTIGADFINLSNKTNDSTAISIDNDNVEIEIGYPIRSGVTIDGISSLSSVTASAGIRTTIVSASSYTSSLNNQVGFLGTSSFSVSSSFAQTAVTASYFSGSVSFPDGLTVGQLTASTVQLTSIVDTTATNKVLVLNTATNQIFTTASVGGGGGSGAGFPFNGNAVITGSLLVSGSSNVLRAVGSGSTVFAVSGSLGPLFEVTDSISGELFTLTSASIDIFKVDNQKNVLVSGSLRVTGSAIVTNDLTVNGGTLSVNAVNNRVNMSGSIAHTGSLTVNALLGGTALIVTGSTNLTDLTAIGNISLKNQIFVDTDDLVSIGDIGSNLISIGPSFGGPYDLGAPTFPWGTLYANRVNTSIVSASAGITGSLAQFNPVSLKITVGTTAPSSPAVNDLWVDTN